MSGRYGGANNANGSRNNLGSTSNFDWRCTSSIKSVAFDPFRKRVYIAEDDEGKMTTLDVNV